jgi:hypothetical protein
MTTMMTVSVWTMFDGPRGMMRLWVFLIVVLIRPANAEPDQTTSSSQNRQSKLRGLIGGNVLVRR